MHSCRQNNIPANPSAKGGKRAALASEPCWTWRSTVPSVMTPAKKVSVTEASRSRNVREVPKRHGAHSAVNLEYVWSMFWVAAFSNVCIKNRMVQKDQKTQIIFRKIQKPTFCPYFVIIFFPKNLPILLSVTLCTSGRRYQW